MIPRDRILDKLDSLLTKKDFAAAKRLLQYWLDEANATRDAHGVLLIENEWMGLCRKLGEEEEALRHAQNALDQVANMGIEDNVGAATTYLNCATVCKAFGRGEGAIHLFRMAQKIYERELPPNDERLAGLYNNMGLALVDQRNFQQAEEMYRKALAILETLTEKEPEEAITYLNLASAAEAKKGAEGARELIAEYSRKAADLLEIGKDRSDGHYAFVCEKCASVLEDFGFREDAARLKERYGRIYEGA